MRVSVACVLALISSALGYQVTQPNTSEGWTDVGSQPLVWQRVETDPLNFTVVLTNINSANEQQVLAALVDGTLGNTTCNPPSGGWPTGNGFRVNFVKDADDLNTILAQSSQFAIKVPSSNSTSIISSGTSSASFSQPTVPTIGVTTTAGGSSSTSTLAPASSNGALRHIHAHVGLWGGVLGFLGFFLA